MGLEDECSDAYLRYISIQNQQFDVAAFFNSQHICLIQTCLGVTLCAIPNFTSAVVTYDCTLSIIPAYKNNNYMVLILMTLTL